MSISNVSCIYKLYFNDQNKIYIGSTKNLNQRIREHKSLLKLGKHENIIMQRSYNKHKVFNFEIMELVSEQALIGREQEYIDNLKPHYNINKIAGKPPSGPISQLRMKKLKDWWTPERRKEMSLRKKGKLGGRAKLTLQQIQDIFKLRSSGLSLSKIGKRYSLGASSIEKLINGKSYKALSSKCN